MSSSLLIAIAAVLTALNAGDIIRKLVRNKSDIVMDAKTKAETTSQEVTTLREVIAEVRLEDAAKKTRLDGLEERVGLLEERERHMLTRAAVHEAWDQMAFSFLVAQDKNYPAPPPLTTKESHGEHDHG